MRPVEFFFCCCYGDDFIIIMPDLSQAGQWGEMENSDCLIELLFCAQAESTVRKHQRAYYRWRQWAIGRQQVPLPAQPLELCSYLQSIGSTTGSKSAVEESVNAVSWVHTTGVGMNLAIGSLMFCHS